MTRKQRRILQIEHALRQPVAIQDAFKLMRELVALKNGATVAGARKARDA